MKSKRRETMKITKSVTCSGGGIVDASVAVDGVTVQSTFYMYRVFFETPKALEKRMIKAHRWADGVIDVVHSQYIVNSGTLSTP